MNTSRIFIGLLCTKFQQWRFTHDTETSMTTERNTRRQLILGALGATALASSPARLLAQGWPERSITFICPWPAGGTADQSMRALCSVAARVLGQPGTLERIQLTCPAQQRAQQQQPTDHSYPAHDAHPPHQARPYLT